MDNIKYKYEYNNITYLIKEKSKYDENEIYPVYTSKVLKHYHIDNKEIELLDFPLNVLKSKDKSIIYELREKWENYKDFLSDVDGINNFSNVYKYNEYYYIILRNKTFELTDDNKIIFEKGIDTLGELGVFNLDDRLINEIFELDQNFQSTDSLELIIELLAENTDMNKYIPFLKNNIKEEDLSKLFFFDEYIYNIFIKKYIDSLKEIAVYKQDPYGRKGIERFLDISLKGVYNDECKCYNV